jgi:GNAT superfamily N-acetyltransferase
MKNNPEIRQALETDASDIAELIYSTSVACCFAPEQPCPEWYRESVQLSQIANLLRSEQMVWLVATQEQTLAGVLAVSDKSHVKYFFVHPAYQKLGIGKQLWRFASRSGVLGNSLTVRSSLFAVPVYERLGFVAIEPPKTFNGMQYQTMVAKYG